MGHQNLSRTAKVFTARGNTHSLENSFNNWKKSQIYST